MITVRRAESADAAELVRLRAVMIRDAFGEGDAPQGEWSGIAERQFRVRLGDSAGLLAAFVVDRPDEPGLASCAVRSVDTRIASPNSPNGESGYIFNVATDPAYRSRGYSRACIPFNASDIWHNTSSRDRTGIEEHYLVSLLVDDDLLPLSYTL